MAKMGRPSKYKKEYDLIAYNACKEKGFTNDDLAKLFDVNVDSIYEWCKVHKHFSESIKKGKDEFDTDYVEKTLLQRAMGYEYTEKTSKLIGRRIDKDGKVINDGKLVVMQEITKQVVPDTTAIIFWLKNRNNKRWKDLKRQEIVSDEKKPLMICITDQSKRNDKEG
jgi:hypothetical protein